MLVVYRIHNCLMYDVSKLFFMKKFYDAVLNFLIIKESQKTNWIMASTKNIN